MSAGPGEVYERVLAWKGSVSLRQQEMRFNARDTADPLARSLRAGLEQATRKLALLTRAVPDARTSANPVMQAAQRQSLDDLSVLWWSDSNTIWRALTGLSQERRAETPDLC